jgi:hypothetical protein
MNHSAARVGTGKIIDFPIKISSAKLKTLATALAIIAGIGGLVTAGVGLGGYLQAGTGTLGSLSQLHAITMVVLGGSGGVILLSAGIIYRVKRHQRKGNQPSNDTKHSKSAKNTNLGSSVEAQHGASKIYGPAAWMNLNVKVLDAVSDIPKFDFNGKDPYFNQPFWRNYAFFYIPERILVDGKEQRLTLKIFKEIVQKAGGSLKALQVVEDQLGESESSTTGWVLLSKKILPGSAKKSYATLQKILWKNGFRMPTLLEATVASFLACEGGEKLYCPESTFCLERTDKLYPISAGFPYQDSEEFYIFPSDGSIEHTDIGIGCAYNNF